MMPSSQNLRDFARAFSDFVRSTIQILIWAIIGFAAIAATYVGARIVWVAAKTILQSIGIEGGI